MNETKPDVLQPILIDLGKQKQRRIKQLKRGQGRLAEQVQEAAERACAQLGDDPREVVPVVVLFRKKDRRP